MTSIPLLKRRDIARISTIDDLVDTVLFYRAFFYGYCGLANVEPVLVAGILVPLLACGVARHRVEGGFDGLPEIVLEESRREAWPCVRVDATKTVDCRPGSAR